MVLYYVDGNECIGYHKDVAFFKALPGFGLKLVLSDTRQLSEQQRPETWMLKVWSGKALACTLDPPVQTDMRSQVRNHSGGRTKRWTWTHGMHLAWPSLSISVRLFELQQVRSSSSSRTLRLTFTLKPPILWSGFMPNTCPRCHLRTMTPPSLASLWGGLGGLTFCAMTSSTQPRRWRRQES